MNKKLNNKGFTLTELLIAVVILAVAAIPILANFAQSGRINFKARTTLDATNMAQDIMEGLSAYTESEVIEIFSDTTVGCLNGKVLPNYITGYTSHSITALGNDKYNLTVNGISNAKNEYNVDIVVSPAEYENNGTLTNKTNNINDSTDKSANIPEIEVPYDAVYKITDSDFSAALEKFKNSSSTPAKIYETATGGEYSIVGKIERDIEIKIENTDPVNKNYVVSIKSTYTIPSSTDYTYYGLTSANNSVVVTNKTNISQMGQENLPRAVYLYYQGMPGATGSNDKLDDFYVTNLIADSTPITVYLIRMIDSPDTTGNVDTLSALSSAANASYNQNYRARIVVQDADLHTSIVTNARADLSEATYTSTSDSDARCIYAYNPVGLNDADIQSANIAEADLNDDTKNGGVASNKKKFYNGFEKTKKNFVYTVTVSVTDVKKNRKVASFDGSLSN